MVISNIGVTTPYTPPLIGPLSAAETLEQTQGITLTRENGAITSVTVGEDFDGREGDLLKLLASFIREVGKEEDSGQYAPKLTRIVPSESLTILAVALNRFMSAFLDSADGEAEVSEKASIYCRLVSLLLTGGSATNNIDNSLIRFISTPSIPTTLSAEFVKLTIDLIHAGSKVILNDLLHFITHFGEIPSIPYYEILNALIDHDKNFRAQVPECFMAALRANKEETAQFLIERARDGLEDYFREKFSLIRSAPSFFSNTIFDILITTDGPCSKRLSIFKSLMSIVDTAFQGDKEKIAKYLNTPYEYGGTTIAHTASRHHYWAWKNHFDQTAESDLYEKIQYLRSIMDILFQAGARSDLFDFNLNTPQSLNRSGYFTSYHERRVASLMGSFTASPLTPSDSIHDFSVYLLRASKALKANPDAILENVQIILNNIHPDPTHRNTRRTLLHTVTNLAAARLLIDRGANVNAEDNDRQTPLHTTTSKDVAQLLIESGARLEAKDFGGRAPLHTTSSKDVAQLLINRGGRLDEQNQYGQTPLHTTTSKAVAQLLINHGARLDARDHAHRTPLMTAAIRENAQYNMNVNHLTEVQKNAELSRLEENFVLPTLIKNSTKEDLLKVDTTGQTALHYVVRSFYLAELLILGNPTLVGIKNNSGQTFYDLLAETYDNNIPDTFQELMNTYPIELYDDEEGIR